MKVSKNSRNSPPAIGPEASPRTCGLAERSDAEQAEFFKSALDHVPEIVWYKDAENNVLWGNRAALTSTGVSLEQVAGFAHHLEALPTPQRKLRARGVQGGRGGARRAR